MRRLREKEPFVRTGDQILIRNGGGLGTWLVRASRYATDDPYDEKIDIVLSRGSFTFKTEFDSKRMGHICDVPPERLHRDMRKVKPIRFKPRK